MAAFNIQVDCFVPQPDCSTMELSQQTREIEARVQSLCTQLSDTVTNNTFLKEQLQLAQGEHSDKGKQLSHLEGRLLELEKALKESRTLENSLQGQVSVLSWVISEPYESQMDLWNWLSSSGWTAVICSAVCHSILGCKNGSTGHYAQTVHTCCAGTHHWFLLSYITFTGLILAEGHKVNGKQTCWLHFLAQFSTDEDVIWCIKAIEIENWASWYYFRVRFMLSWEITAVHLDIY